MALEKNQNGMLRTALWKMYILMVREGCWPGPLLSTGEGNAQPSLHDILEALDIAIPPTRTTVDTSFEAHSAPDASPMAGSRTADEGDSAVRSAAETPFEADSAPNASLLAGLDLGITIPPTENEGNGAVGTVEADAASFGAHQVPNGNLTMRMDPDPIGASYSAGQAPALLLDHTSGYMMGARYGVDGYDSIQVTPSSALGCPQHSSAVNSMPSSDTGFFSSGPSVDPAAIFPGPADHSWIETMNSYLN